MNYLTTAAPWFLLLPLPILAVACQTRAPERCVIARPTTTAVSIARSFAAPRAEVYDAMTDAERFRAWAGTAEYPVRIERHELRVGGRYRYVFALPEQQELVMIGEFSRCRTRASDRSHRGLRRL